MAKKSHWIIEKPLQKMHLEICISMKKEKPILIYHKTEDWQSVFLVRFLGCFTRIKNSGNYRCRVLIQPAIDYSTKRFCHLPKRSDLLNENREDFLKHNSHPTAFTKDIPWKKEIF